MEKKWKQFIGWYIYWYAATQALVYGRNEGYQYFQRNLHNCFKIFGYLYRTQQRLTEAEIISESWDQLLYVSIEIKWTYNSTFYISKIWGVINWKILRISLWTAVIQNVGNVSSHIFSSGWKYHVQVGLVCPIQPFKHILYEQMPKVHEKILNDDGYPWSRGFKYRFNNIAPKVYEFEVE